MATPRVVIAGTDTDMIIMREYDRDIDDLRGGFAGVDRRDARSLKAWLSAHPYLSVNDIARIASVCRKTVYNWLQRVGLPAPAAKARRPVPPRWTNRPKDVLVAPPGWDTDWIVAMYEKGYSLPQLGQATGRSHVAIMKRMARRKVGCRSVKDSVRTAHPCCTLAWVFDHYVVRKMSLSDCAKAAGVSRYTFTGWLHSFEIRVRSSVEQIVIGYGTDMGKVTGSAPKRARAC